MISSPPSPASPTAGARLAWIDYARGLAIVLVVYGHCYRGVVGAHILPPDGPLAAVDALIYGFHMPLFFFLSGLFGVRAAALAPWPFWRGRLRTIVWPYVLWMSVELLVLTIFSGSTNMGAISVSPSIYLFEPISPFWFLYTLLFCAAFVHLVLPAGPRLMIALAACLFAVGQAIPVEIVQLTTWGILYYALGAVVAARVQSLRFEQWAARPVILAATCALTLGLGLWLPRLEIGYRWEIPVAVAGSVALFGMAVRLQGAQLKASPLAMIAYLGRISMTILVVHILATAATRIVLAKAFGVQAAWMHLALGTTMGLAVPVVVQVVCVRLGIAGILGLPGQAGPRRLQGAQTAKAVRPSV